MTFPFPRIRSLHGPSVVAFTIAALAITGCGGSADTDQVPPETGSRVEPSSEPGGAAAAPAPSSSPVTENDNQPTSTSPSGGLQLPETELPADAPEDPSGGGPAKAGGGGIEMPDVAPPQSQSNAPPATDSGSGETGGQDVRAQFASWKEIEQRVQGTGKITVVDLWSTVCEPCIKEFPHLVELHRDMPERIVCIGVDVDYDGRKSRPPETYADKVNAFLTAVDADFQNFICQTASEDVFAELDLPSIPAVLIYDAQGTLVKRFIDSGETLGFTYEKDVIPFLKSLDV
ncbi:TlpA family protein disulfide reductase [Roseiconus nitratireducens]|uniref:TlpA family protein disulfide reductase n=1 Tax=Roseiconus nitratireducens TaxID=2605748 RepID=A0A5M6DBM7_9BACT|nr:TlpA disulfide reductase family protein [Roseiconus nitratireducens]KAA5542555.1 TlpA family protein disulfide reductase [Roseiconus nitratireducens]